jgi:hypothetical protein
MGVERRDMENQKISLDIRTILSQLDIDFERYRAWEEVRQVEMWEDNEWLERIQISDQQVAAQG